MNFPKFWARGESGGFSTWRWSDSSVDEAQFQAQQAAARLEAQFNANGRPGDRYGYADRPLREPVLREIRTATGELASVVTRNAYGCEVLNSSNALFVDVDLPPQEAKSGSIFASLFGKKAPEPEDPAKPAIDKAMAWAQAHPGWNWRIYRTRAGLRLLATHALFDPADPMCEAVFEAVNSDPLYRKLCQTQKCFRARLTPKPWRCDIPNPPGRWPFESTASEQRFVEWDRTYQAASRNKATCQLLDQGAGEVHTELRDMIALHDEKTRATSTLELA